MIQEIEVTILIPTYRFICDLVVAYFIVGFPVWLAWCVSEAWHDYGRRSRKFDARDFARILAAWCLWFCAFDVIRKNMSPHRFNCDYNYYR